ncbi:hypothetical protein POX_c04599 [Penicillium oxalicum]|uniref:hypothetical protein n=1 Tax=Penicillium oxalicum TaxID=69781 RepID=UPI0020B870B2|nr:hypothetical protein POX_c04599 [Penicillium oxalicum]KAI2791723.1 hypothetical protein POX_c04599 [Penicillium oxalicum]
MCHSSFYPFAALGSSGNLYVGLAGRASEDGDLDNFKDEGSLGYGRLRATNSG